MQGKVIFSPAALEMLQVSMLNRIVLKKSMRIKGERW